MPVHCNQVATLCLIDKRSPLQPLCTPPLRRFLDCFLPSPPLTPPMQRGLEEFLYPDSNQLLARLTASTGPRFRALNRSVAMLLDEFSLVSFVPLDISDEER